MTFLISNDLFITFTPPIECTRMSIIRRVIGTPFEGIYHLEQFFAELVTQQKAAYGNN